MVPPMSPDLFHLYTFLLGAVFTASVAVGLFFFRFWRRLHDRLFLVFAVAFWLMALNWGAVAFIPHSEAYSAIYLLRLLAFICIIAGIIDKNRAATRAEPRG